MSLCWSHIPRCWKSHFLAYFIFSNSFSTVILACIGSNIFCWYSIVLHQASRSAQSANACWCNDLCVCTGDNPPGQSSWIIIWYRSANQTITYSCNKTNVEALLRDLYSYHARIQKFCQRGSKFDMFFLVVEGKEI